MTSEVDRAPFELKNLILEYLIKGGGGAYLILQSKYGSGAVTLTDYHRHLMSSTGASDNVECRKRGRGTSILITRHLITKVHPFRVFINLPIIGHLRCHVSRKLY